MKQALFAMLLVFGVSVSNGVFACDMGDHASKSGTSAPSAPAAPAK